MGLPIGFGPPDTGDLPDYNPGMDVAIWEELVSIWGTIVQVANFFWSLITTIVSVLVFIFRALLKFLKHIWENYVKAAIVWIYNHAIKQDSWLQRHIRAVVKRLQKIKDWYDKHILKQQLRMLQFLQTIRRFLGILRLFHVKWAAALGQVLVDIQNRIEQTIRITRGIFSDDEVATIDKQHSLYFTSTVQTHQQALVTSGPTQDDLDNRKAARQALTDEINAPLPF